jgi:hypothetical protein
MSKASNACSKTIDRVVVSDVRILGKLSARTFASRLQGAKLRPETLVRWHRAAFAAIGGVQ